MAALSSRRAICLLLVVLSNHFAQPTPKMRREAAAIEPPREKQSSSPFHNFLGKLKNQKPFRTLDSAILLLGGGRSKKPVADKKPSLSTESPKPIPETSDEYLSVDCMIMDPDKPTPKCNPVVPEPLVTSPSIPLSVDATTWNLHRLSKDPCGVSYSTMPDGDRQVSLGQFPWLALLRYTAKDDSVKTFCSGSLINDRYILTAASCLNVTDYNLTSVRLGEFNLDIDDPDCTEVQEGWNDLVAIEACYGEPPVDYGISSAHEHPKHDSVTGENNIGLVRLSKKVEFTTLIGPVCLPVGDMETKWNGGKVGGDLVLAGWGDNAVPMEALAYGVDSVDCEEAIGDAVTEGQLCASGHGGRALCHGDIGAPLVTPLRIRMPSRPRSRESLMAMMKRRYVQVGLLVSSLPYCDENPPSIFDSLEGFLPWILETVKP